MKMTPRQRVLCALNHEEPDRVPLFIGTSGSTSVLGPGYERLTNYLGIRNGATRWFNKSQQYVWPDEELMKRLGSDGRPVAIGPAESTLRRDVSPDCLVDDWGVTWRKAPGSLYFEMAGHPLRTAAIDDLDRYPWPNLTPPGRFDGAAGRAKALQDAGYATVLLSGVNLFEQACLLRGLDTLLMDMVTNEDFFLAIMTNLTARAVHFVNAALPEIGPFIDVIVTGDDLGMTNGPMMSPASYRRLIKPFEAELLGAIKKHAAAKIFFHSCGNIYPLLGDLADIGVDLLNPVQVSAGAMGDTARLKREFGDRLSFCGGIDSRWVLPHGTTEDVRNEVRQRIRDLAPGGGYVAAAVHCIQPDVPPENVATMCDEVRRAGRYPILS
jgi:uroporphyrinogen decarboxylase